MGGFDVDPQSVALSQSEDASRGLPNTNGVFTKTKKNNNNK